MSGSLIPYSGTSFDSVPDQHCVVLSRASTFLPRTRHDRARYPVVTPECSHLGASG